MQPLLVLSQPALELLSLPGYCSLCWCAQCICRCQCGAGAACAVAASVSAFLRAYLDAASIACLHCLPPLPASIAVAASISTFLSA